MLSCKTCPLEASSVTRTTLHVDVIGPRSSVIYTDLLHHPNNTVDDDYDYDDESNNNHRRILRCRFRNHDNVYDIDIHYGTHSVVMAVLE